MGWLDENGRVVAFRLFEPLVRPVLDEFVGVLRYVGIGLAGRLGAWLAWRHTMHRPLDNDVILVLAGRDIVMDFIVANEEKHSLGFTPLAATTFFKVRYQAALAEPFLMMKEKFLLVMVLMASGLRPSRV